MKQLSVRKRPFWLVLLFINLMSLSLAFADEIPVSSFYGKYDASMKRGGQQSLSLRGPKIERWDTAEKADKPYRIGVLLPSLQDSYWSAVNYGVIHQAQESGIAIQVLDAGGYANLDVQQQQMAGFVESGVDGIILGSISYTKNNALIRDITRKGIPVVAVVNDIEASSITAKSMVSYYDMGFFSGEYVVEQAEGAQQEVKVVFLAGPKNSGWAGDTVAGFKAATEFASADIRVVDVYWGDTTAESQSVLLKEALSSHPDVDYVIGNAVAAEVAADMRAEKRLKADIVSTYITPRIYDEIRAGRIVAAPADMMVDQSRIAVGMMLKLLKGQKAGVDLPFRVGPLIPVVTQENIRKHSFEHLLGPRNFEPVFQWQP